MVYLSFTINEMTHLFQMLRKKYFLVFHRESLPEDKNLHQHKKD